MAEPTLITAGRIPAAAHALELVLRDARRLDGELLEFFDRAAIVARDLEAAGVKVEFSFPMLVGHAHELFSGLKVEEARSWEG